MQIYAVHPWFCSFVFSGMMEATISEKKENKNFKEGKRDLFLHFERVARGRKKHTSADVIPYMYARVFLLPCTESSASHAIERATGPGKLYAVRIIQYTPELPEHLQVSMNVTVTYNYFSSCANTASMSCSKAKVAGTKYESGAEYSDSFLHEVCAD